MPTGREAEEVAVSVLGNTTVFAFARSSPWVKRGKILYILD